MIQIESNRQVVNQAIKYLYEFTDKSTLVLLSGGSTPYKLYQKLALDKKFNPAAVALVDERFGQPFHPNSNEKMIQKSGLIEYLNDRNIPFINILINKSLTITTDIYEQKIKSLFIQYPTKIAIMGIGEDGHTAGIMPKTNYNHTKFVIGYNSNSKLFPKRISLSFEALDQVKIFIVLIMSEKKKTGLNLILNSDDPFSVPGAIYQKLHSKVYLITDFEYY